MRWSVTFNRLPESTEIDGVLYQINFGYRAMMAAEIEMFREELSDEQKLLNALNIFYFGNIPDDMQKAVDYLLWFYRCGEEEKKEAAGHRRRKGRAYCFDKDAPLIYAAFRQQYNIDLRRTPNKALHWWEFSAMFEALDDQTKMAKVMYWRTCDLGSLSKGQRKFVEKMRNMYAIRNQDSTMDSKTKLAKRNADMKAYVKKRMEECRQK